jgi:hypothetical protein
MGNLVKIISFFTALVLSINAKSQYNDADVFHSVYQENNLNIPTWDNCVDSTWFVFIDSNEKNNLVNYIFSTLKDSSELFYGNKWMNIYKNYNYLHLDKYSQLSNHGIVGCGSERIIQNAIVNDKLYIGTEKIIVYDSITGQEMYNNETGDVIYRDSIITYSRNELQNINTGFKWFENWNINNKKFIKKSQFISLFLDGEQKKYRFFTYAFSTKIAKEEVKGPLFKSNVIYNFFNHLKSDYDTSEYKKNCNYETDLKIGEFSLIISKILNLIREDSVKLFELNYGTRIFNDQFKRIKNDFFVIYDGEKDMRIDAKQGAYLLITSEESYDGIKFIEDWYFDDNNFNIIKEVKGIELISLDPKWEEGKEEVFLEIPVYISFDGNPPPKKILINHKK